MMRSVSSSAACVPTRGIGAGAEAVRDLGADGQLVGHRRGGERLHVGIENVELDAGQSFVHHARHGVGTAAAHAEHVDPGPEHSFFLNRKFQRIQCILRPFESSF